MGKQFYTMKECFDACGDNDVPFVEKGFNSGWMHTKKYLLRNDSQVSILLIDINIDKWQIKRAESEVLSAEQIYDLFAPSSKVNSAWTNQEVEEIIEKCRQNFRLERDKELKKHVESVYGLGNVCIKKWPPLTKDE